MKSFDCCVLIAVAFAVLLGGCSKPEKKAVQKSPDAMKTTEKKVAPEDQSSDGQKDSPQQSRDNEDASDSKKSNAPEIVFTLNEKVDPGTVANASLATPGFRGPGSAGRYPHAHLPTAWDETRFVNWRCKLIGSGASSPVAMNNRIFATSFTGYGESEEQRGNREQLKHHVTCINQDSGEVLWSRSIKGQHVPKLTENNITHGFASSTPVTDGKNVYAFFGTSGVFAFDYDGELLWMQHVGCGIDNFGTSASLTLHNELLIVNASIEEGKIFALEKATGKGVWQFKGMVRSWSTPVVALNSEGHEELLVNNSKKLHSLYPQTGKLNWEIIVIGLTVVQFRYIERRVQY